MIVDEGVTVVGAEEEQVQHLKQRNVSFVEKLSKSSTQAVFTREQVRRLCVEEGKGQGNSLLVVIFQHHVLDLTKWQHQHPGGLLPLKHLAGE